MDTQKQIVRKQPQESSKDARLVDRTLEKRRG